MRNLKKVTITKITEIKYNNAIMSEHMIAGTIQSWHVVWKLRAETKETLIVYDHSKQCEHRVAQESTVKPLSSVSQYRENQTLTNDMTKW